MWITLKTMYRKIEQCGDISVHSPYPLSSYAYVSTAVEKVGTVLCLYIKEIITSPHTHLTSISTK